MSANVSIPSVTELTKLFINGEFVEPISKSVYTLYNPADDSVVSDHIPIAGAEDIDRAVHAAEKAFRGEWSRFSAQRRTDCLRKLAALLEDDGRLEKILRLDSLSTGNPVAIIPTREKNYIMNHLSYFGESSVTTCRAKFRFR